MLGTKKLTDGHASEESSLPIALQNKSSPAKADGQHKKNWVISNATTGSPVGTMNIKLKVCDVSGLKKRKRKNNKQQVAKKVSFDCEEKKEIEQSRWATHLPEEILIKIFSEAVKNNRSYPFLKRMTKVCSLWRIAASNECLWRKVDLSMEEALKEKSLERLCAGLLSQTQELSLAGWGKKLSLIGIKFISQNCLKLKTINLSRCSRITPSCIQLLVDSCLQLSHIDISGISQTPLSFSSLKYLFENCGQNLTHLILAENCVNNFNSIIKSLAEFCPKLEMLDMSNIRMLADGYLPIEKLQAGCPALRVLRLANSKIAFSPISLAIQAQSPGFPNLEELSIACSSVSLSSLLGDAELERLLKTSVKLKLLDVRGCRNISVSGLVRIPAWELEHLYLSKCDATSTPGLELVLKKWGHSLKEVDLSWSLHADSINQAILALSSVDGPTKLRVLDVGGSAIGLSSIKSLLTKYSQLEKLNLQSCRSLPRGIKRLYSGCHEIDILRGNMTDSRFE